MKNNCKCENISNLVLYLNIANMYHKYYQAFMKLLHHFISRCYYFKHFFIANAC